MLRLTCPPTGKSNEDSDLSFVLKPLQEKLNRRPSEEYCYGMLETPQHWLFNAVPDVIEFFAGLRLAVVEIRFNQQYAYSENIDWSEPFETDTTLFEEVLRNLPENHCRIMSYEDALAFRGFGKEDIIDSNSNRLGRLIKRWTILQSRVSECIYLQKGWVDYFHVLASVC